MLKVYTHPASQPSRAVLWACVMKGLEFELYADPATMSGVNPRGQLPIIDDAGFKLAEMPAILSYLAEKHEWRDLYPEDIQARARIQAYLHAHHCLTRLATLKLMAPHVLVVFGGNPGTNPLSHISNTSIDTAMADEEKLSHGQELVSQIITFLEENHFCKDDFLAGTSGPSLADIACFEELQQLGPANLLDLSQWPALTAWLARMRELPHHDALHRFNSALGDIATTPNTMERFGAAITAAMNDLTEIAGVNLAA